MKGSEDVQETDGQRQKVHAGKLIHMLSPVSYTHLTLPTTERV